MSSTAADVHPALPPIRTTTAPACSSAASSSTAPAPAPDAESVALAPAEKQQQHQQKGEASRSESQEKEQEQEADQAEPTTPTSEGSRLRPPAECPPAPRKPAWVRPLTQHQRPPPSTPAKRKLPSSEAAPTPSRRAFFPVACDLTTVFQALPPPKKRTIRAG